MTASAETRAVLQHFVGQIFEGGDMGNGTTMDRTRNDSRISIQDLESYYLRPFRAALVNGNSPSHLRDIQNSAVEGNHLV